MILILMAKEPLQRLLRHQGAERTFARRCLAIPFGDLALSGTCSGGAAVSARSSIRSSRELLLAVPGICHA